MSNTERINRPRHRVDAVPGSVCLLLCAVVIISGCRLYLPLPLSITVSLGELPPNFLQVLDREGGVLSYPEVGGGVGVGVVQPGERMVRLEMDPGAWIPVQLHLRGGGPGAGGVIWKDLAGPGRSEPLWSLPGPTQPCSDPVLTLTMEGGALAGVLLSVLEYRRELHALDIMDLHRRMMEKGDGNPGAVDLHRLRADLLGSLRFARTGTIQAFAAQSVDGTFWIPLPEALMELGNEHFPLRLSPLSPLCGTVVELDRTGRISCTTLNPGGHRFLIPPENPGAAAGWLDLLIFCAENGESGNRITWRLLQ